MFIGLVINLHGYDLVASQSRDGSTPNCLPLRYIMLDSARSSMGSPTRAMLGFLGSFCSASMSKLWAPLLYIRSPMANYILSKQLSPWGFLVIRCSKGAVFEKCEA